MSKTDKTFTLFRILVSGTNAQATGDLESIVESASQFSVVKSGGAKLDKVEDGARVDAIVLSCTELDNEALDLLNQSRAKFPNLPIIIVSDKLNEDQTRQLIKLRVHDWLHHPVENSALIKAIESGIRGARIETNKVHAVVSGCGGAGATTLAVSIADLLVSQEIKDGESVALFDLDFATGNCGYSLNMVNSFQLDKVIANPQRIDAEFANLIQERQRSGFHIYSFKRPELLTDDNGYELVLRMLDAVNLQHEYTVLDIPYYETEWRDDVLAAVNSCTIVTETNLPALKHTLDTLEKVRGLRDGQIPVQIVINKNKTRLFGKKLTDRKLKELFGDTPCFFLSRDDDLLEESLDRGVLPREIAGRSRFIRGLKKYLKLMLSPSLEAQ